MKKVKQEGGGGLQEWLSYQSRTRETSQPETDTIDWDDGIQVQEEWLPRELCEQRLREEAERKLAPALKNPPLANVPVASETAAAPLADAAAMVEVENVPLAAPVAAELPQPTSLAVDLRPEVKASSARESATREFKSKAAPTQLETDDLVSALPAFRH